VAKVLDTSALLDFFRDGPSAGQVEELLVHAEAVKQPVLISALTWGELYQHGLKQSQIMADRLMKEISVLPIEIVLEDQHLELARLAATFQADGKLHSVSEAYAAALAKMRRAELCTLNKSFAALKGEIKVRLLSDQ
jgi:predicted nucleic acid-binding protein